MENAGSGGEHEVSKTRGLVENTGEPFRLTMKSMMKFCYFKLQRKIIGVKRVFWS